ncbi:carbonic anhydrase [Glutamicibacter sp. MNS18]|uniref:carbonic anhydrase n=1 Tax=Glutamicibacter sp. MNS18 TaxID=2989817 RepID=UPI002236839A|nr:carbonic anhydrase [Glutamicibacter sp. MNS18]MCW4465091.1 carbonic anhydrase [Glutamicibacter sp. MNS18]
MLENNTTRPATPREAWQRLREGNFRFINGQTQHPNQDGARRQSLVETQEPFAVIFGCSDSRLAAEIIFDVGLGDVFVVRTAGHVIDTASLGSLEYAIDLLNIPLIIILGHDNCGAVTSAIKAKESGRMPKGFIRDLVEHITPSVFAAESHGLFDVNSTVVEHVAQTTERLLERSRIISDAVDEGRTAVVGITYRLAEGKAQLVSGFGVS